jgi:methyl-accepting chemotaxis protein
MRNLTIQTRLVGTMILIVIMLLAISAFALRSVNTITGAVNDVAENTVPSVLTLYTVKSGAQKESVALALSTGDVSIDVKQKFVSQRAQFDAEINASIKKYDALISDDEDRRLFNEVKRAQVELSVAASRAQLSDPAYGTLITNQIIPLADALSAAVEADIDYNLKLNDAASGLAKSTSQSSNVYLPIGVLVTLLGIAGLSIWLIRTTNSALGDIATNLGEGSRQTAAAAGQVSSSSQALSQGAADQASAVEETSASLEEISAMIRSTADNAVKAKDLAGEARNVAEKGTRTMADMDAAMAAIDASSAEVAKIVKNIDEIAFQTNILALNAAVEAARAGQAGAGFAVVADEVRSLAQRSAAAAKETAEKIDAAIANSRRGSECTAMVGESLTQIAERIAQTDQIVGFIATAASEQALGISQIGVALNQIDNISQQNSSTAQQSAAAAEQLDAQASVMDGLVRRLDLLLGRKSDEHARDRIESASYARRSAPTFVAPSRPANANAGRRQRTVRPSLSNESIPMPMDDGQDGSRTFSA